MPGKNSLGITPKYGNRVDLVSIITGLPLEPDPLCEEDLCPEKCWLCLEACAAGARWKATEPLSRTGASRG
ncbi:MAG: hypothetical protein HPY55_01035 [Firmicutes bacterium]|nr:hypothetical protein [Bacillota bacterium]